MEGWRNTFTAPGPGAVMEVSGRAEALAADLRVQAQQLGEIRGRALAVAMLSWDSPAGANFRSYLRERCGEILRSIELLEAAAHHLGGYGDQLREAELSQGGAGS